MSKNHLAKASASKKKKQNQKEFSKSQAKLEQIERQIGSSKKKTSLTELCHKSRSRAKQEKQSNQLQRQKMIKLSTYLSFNWPYYLI